MARGQQTGNKPDGSGFSTTSVEGSQHSRLSPPNGSFAAVSPPPALDLVHHSDPENAGGTDRLFWLYPELHGLGASGTPLLVVSRDSVDPHSRSGSPRAALHH